MTDDEFEPSLVDMYILRPRLFRSLLEDVKPDDPDSLRRFYYSQKNWYDCLTRGRHVRELGMTLPQIMELRERAWDAEEAATRHALDQDPDHHGYGRRPLGMDTPLSRTMTGAIETLLARGLEKSRAACVLEIHPRWVDHVAGNMRLTDRDRAVIKAHIDGQTVPQITKATLVPPDTVKRIVKRWLHEEPRTNRRSDSAERGRKACQMHRLGVPVPEIAEKLGVSEGAVRKYIIRYRARAAE